MEQSSAVFSDDDSYESSEESEELQQKRKTILKSLMNGAVVCQQIDKDEITDLVKIGEGAFGIVYKAKCRDEIVAVKQLKKKETEDNLIQKFLAEVAIMQHLTHPNVVGLLGIYQPTNPHDNWLLVSQFMPRGNLENYLREEKDISLERKFLMTLDIISGMNWLHSSNPQIIHRDLKPENIFIDSNYTCKVADFGLSEIKPKQNLYFKTDKFRGSVLYSAPEALRLEDLGPAIDVYSFSLCWWEIFTQTGVFSNHSDPEVFKKAICEIKERPDIPHRAIPAPVAKIMVQCWDHNPSKRPTFKKLKKIIPKARVQSYLATFDKEAVSFWRKHFKNRYKVPLKSFTSELVKYCTGWRNNKEGVRAMALTLRALVSDDGTNISLEAFQKLLRWFGPINAEEEGNIFYKIEETMNQSWFHGDIEAVNAQGLLSEQAKGSFLVRMCVNNNVHDHPWTISYVDTTGEIQHIRIRIVLNQDGYRLVIQVPGKKGAFKGSTRITEFITALTRKYPKTFHSPAEEVSGNKIKMIWRGVKIKTRYDAIDDELLEQILSVIDTVIPADDEENEDENK